jgi:hypothetical protein
VQSHAGGEFTQNRWDKVINRDHAEKWNHQIPDEVTRTHVK